MSVCSEGKEASFQGSEVRNNLQTILQSLHKLTGLRDSRESENLISKLVKFLDSLSDAALSDPDVNFLGYAFFHPDVNFLDSLSDAAIFDPDSENKVNAFVALSEIHRYICSPSLNQEVVDALSFELPKAVSKFAGISRKFSDMAISIIDQFIAKCSPRDMLIFLCHTLGYATKVTNAVSYIVPPLSGISKALIAIRRRHFELVQGVIPTILSSLKAVHLVLGEEVEEIANVFDRAVEIANSIYEVCNKLVNNDAREKLRALLGLYVLQCLALLAASNCETSCYHSLVLQLSRISSYCGLSYLSLVTTYDVEAVASTVFGEDKDDCMDCLSHVKHGAAIAVVWGHVSEEVSHAAKEDIIAVKDELRNNQIKRWQAIGTLTHLLSFRCLSWELKEHTINFLISITDGDIRGKWEDEHSQWSSYMPNIFSALQAVIDVIVFPPDLKLQKSSLTVLKGVLADIPISQRLDIVKELITNTECSSSISVLVDLIRREMHASISSCTLVVKNVQQINNKAHPYISFWAPSVFELVELVLKPPQGGSPSLPEQRDAVLSVLNLYRYVLMKESTGKTNYTGVLSRSSLLKVYNEWLLPLRILVTGIMTENKSSVCNLNLLEMVLCLCIELVEEKLKQVK